jgi:hypothetical protein
VPCSATLNPYSCFWLRNQVSNGYRTTRKIIVLHILKKTVFWDVTACILNYLWSWALLEKLTVVRPLKNFPSILWNPKVHCHGPYPEPDWSSSYHPILPLLDLFQYCPLNYVLVFLVVSFLLAFLRIPADFFWHFVEAVSIFRAEAICSHHYVTLKSDTAYLNLLISQEEMGRQNILHWTAGISYNCYVNMILVRCVPTQPFTAYRAMKSDLLLLFPNILIVPHFWRMCQPT